MERPEVMSKLLTGARWLSSHQAPLWPDGETALLAGMVAKGSSPTITTTAL